MTKKEIKKRIEFLQREYKLESETKNPWRLFLIIIELRIKILTETAKIMK